MERALISRAIFSGIPMAKMVKFKTFQKTNFVKLYTQAIKVISENEFSALIVGRILRSYFISRVMNELLNGTLNDLARQGPQFFNHPIKIPTTLLQVCVNE